MPVHKRTPGLDADDYYVAGSTVRRSARAAEEPTTRRAPDRREERQRRPRREEPTQDTRSRQDRRRAECDAEDHDARDAVEDADLVGPEHVGGAPYQKRPAPQQKVDGGKKQGEPDGGQDGLTPRTPVAPALPRVHGSPSKRPYAVQL